MATRTVETEEELSTGRWPVREELHGRRRRTQLLTDLKSYFIVLD